MSVREFFQLFRLGIHLALLLGVLSLKLRSVYPILQA